MSLYVSSSPQAPLATPPWVRQAKPVETSSALLHCLHLYVSHLNRHEAALVANGGGRGLTADAGSAHARVARAVLDFYVVQLRHLPDISARVVNLVQLMARYVYI